MYNRASFRLLDDVQSFLGRPPGFLDCMIKSALRWRLKFGPVAAAMSVA